MSASVNSVSGVGAAVSDPEPIIPPTPVAPPPASAADDVADIQNGDGSVIVVVTDSHGLVVSTTLIEQANTAAEVAKPDGSLTLVLTAADGHVIQTTPIELAAVHVQADHAEPFLHIEA